MSLSEALDRLAHESDQLSHHAQANTTPAGPFTSAYLYLTPGSNVLSLIRDARDNEKRPFKILSTPSTSTGYVDRRPAVQKAESVPLPTRVKGDLDGVLSAASQLLAAISGSYPLARYEAHVSSLSQQHREQAGEIERLKAEIDAIAHRPPPEPVVKEEVPELSVDEAIAAEEAALRALEEDIAPLRHMRPAPSSPRSPKSPRVAKSPPSSVRKTAPPTPMQFPGTTPRRSVPPATPSRFEPLALFGTPRATPRPPPLGSVRKEAPPSMRREPPSARKETGRSIFGVRKPALGTEAPERGLGGSTSGLGASTSQRSLGASTSERASSQRREEPRVRTPPPASPETSRTPAPEPPAASAVSTSTSAPPPPKEKETGGIDTSDPEVLRGIETVWAKLGDVMRMLGEPAREPLATISHLRAVSESPATDGVTQEGAMMAAAALVLLRGNGAAMADLRSSLQETARAKGWGEDLAQRTIYAGVGRKAWRIDRKVPGGRVHLA